MDVVAEETEPLPSGVWARTRHWDVGIDLGQASDPTALCAIESVSWKMHSRTQKPPPDYFHIRALRRLPLGTSYVEQCQELATLLAHPQLVGAKVYIDAGGVGRPVSDLFKRAGIKHTPIWITGGRDENSHNGGYTVPKLTLISRLQATLHSGELKIAKTLPESGAFARELREFRVSFTEAGNIQFGARQGAHDDLVLAAALAMYGATMRRRRTSSVEPLRI